MTCPSCSSKGRKLSLRTLLAFAKQEDLRQLNTQSQWYLCTSSDCQIGYFSSNETISTASMLEVPFHKGTSLQRKVCFCFGYSVKDLDEDIRTKGVSSIEPSIREACQKGLQSCETLNPQGRCCLGNINSILRNYRDGGDPNKDEGCCKMSSPRKVEP